MNAGRVRGAAWVAGGYLVGAIPAAYLVARATGARDVLALASANSSDADAHLLLAEHAGAASTAVAMAGDVGKAMLVSAAAKRAGVSAGWRATTAVAVVAGHAFPPFARRFAGRGLAAAAGVTLVNLPAEMVVAGSALLAGKALGYTGAGSTVGFASVPAVAAVAGRPRSMVAMGAGVLGVILARRLVGIAPVAARDGWKRSVARRLAFDSDDTRSDRRMRRDGSSFFNPPRDTRSGSRDAGLGVPSDRE
ncbi:MAG TPA: glycerol-3-phosphate acyltransferase [Actinomycetota bacterium]|nr:glycerol-3-phosphate acyltransferase [Actinomycetota bacterium]